MSRLIERNPFDPALEKCGDCGRLAYCNPDNDLCTQCEQTIRTLSGGKK